MFVDGRHSHLKEVGDQGLREPEGFILKAAFDARAPILGLVEENFSVRR